MARPMTFTPAQVADIARMAIETTFDVLLECLRELPADVRARDAAWAVSEGRGELSAGLVAKFDQWAAAADGGEFL